MNADEVRFEWWDYAMPGAILGREWCCYAVCPLGYGYGYGQGLLEAISNAGRRLETAVARVTA